MTFCKTLLSPSNVHDGSLSSRILPKPLAMKNKSKIQIFIRFFFLTYHINIHDHHMLLDIAFCVFHVHIAFDVHDKACISLPISPSKSRSFSSGDIDNE